MAGGELLARAARAATRRPAVAVALLLVLAIAGAGLALRLDTRASIDTLVDRDSEAFQASERFRAQFGDEAIVVLVEGDLEKTMLTPDLGRLLRLEGCLSGNVPSDGLAKLPAPCRELADLKPAKVLYGPATFANVAAGRIADAFGQRQAAADKQAEAAAAAARARARKAGASRAEQRAAAADARNAVKEDFQRYVVGLGLRYGLGGVPSIDSPSFISRLVFQGGRGESKPKPRFSYLFPSDESALIQLRLRPDLTDAQRTRAVALVKAAVADPTFKPAGGQRYVVSGVPVLIDGLADAVRRSAIVLLLAALVVMAATLLLVFRSRPRLLPLALALGAAAITFGGLSLAGGSLTMASIAALPVLIGLAVDYAIQFQARYDEAARSGSAGAAVRAAAMGGPTILAAALATLAGFLVLLLSPVPMVRGFGAVLVVGVAIAFVCALTVGLAVLAARAARPADLPPALPRTRAALAGARGRMGRAAGRLGGGGAREAAARRWSALRTRAGELSQRTIGYSLVQPRRVLAIGLAAAVLGLALDTQTEVVSDVQRLVPGNLPALQDARRLQAATGVSGEIDVTVRAQNLTDPSVLRWMEKFQEEALAANGYTPGATCSQKPPAPDLCPALSLPDLFETVDADSPGSVQTLLDAVPPYFSQAVISADRKTANLAFGIRLMPLDRQQRLIEDLRRRLNPPPGVEASLVGVPVLAAEGNAALASPWRRLALLLAALAAVFLVLVAIRRRLDQALVPLVPIALAAGWSALVLFLLRIPLNPMSAALAALVIAISTEFSVLLSARYQQEREAGASPGQAVERAYRSTGAAVLASGLTAIAGFAALLASDIRMLRDFGAVTVIDLSVSLLGVMVVLPAALVWAEGHAPVTLRSLAAWRPSLSRPSLRRPSLRRPRRPSLRQPFARRRRDA